MDNDEKIDYTREDWIMYNQALEELGLPQMIISGNAVYPDEYHKFIGVGYLIKEQP